VRGENKRTARAGESPLARRMRGDALSISSQRQQSNSSQKSLREMSLNDMIEERNIFTLRRKGELTNSSNARAA
jgi:hypothetical protein